MPTAKKAWHLSGAQVRCGWFNAPISFSKENSKLPPTFEDRRFGNKYPACFFTSSTPHMVCMVCIKMLNGYMQYWFVHEGRADYIDD